MRRLSGQIIELMDATIAVIRAIRVKFGASEPQYFLYDKAFDRISDIRMPSLLLLNKYLLSSVNWLRLRSFFDN